MSSTKLFPLFLLVAMVAVMAACGPTAPKGETTPGTAEASAQIATPEADTPAPKMQKPAFEEVDANGDGFADVDELTAAFFKKVDADNDGQISREERAAHKAKHKKQGHHHGKGHGHHRRTFEEIDANGDGAITQDECGCPHFEKIDADGDGKVTKEEHNAGRGKHGCPECAAHPKGECPHCAGQKKAECPECAGHPKGECPHCAAHKKGHGHGHHHKRKTFEECDTNSDGFITIDEFKKGERFLGKKDADQDGKLTKEEYEAPRKKTCHCHKTKEAPATK